MRSKEDVMELSQDGFFETYGNRSGQLDSGVKTSVPVIMTSNLQENAMKHKSSGKFGDDIVNNNNPSTHTEPKIKGTMPTYARNDVTKSNESSDPKSQDKMKRRLRKISVDKLSSFGGAVQAAMTRRRKSVSSEQPSLSQLSDRKNERRLSSWISPYPSRKGNFTPAASFPLDDEETDLNGRYNYMALSPTSPYDPNQSPPSPQPSNFVHQGFLDFRNRKKRWERYWCVLQDGCLFCFFTPQSEKSRDIISLKGYDVIADIKNMNRVRFIFHLQQQGCPNIYFSTDNHRDFLLWVGCLEKQIIREKRSSSIPDATTLSNAADDISKDPIKKLSLKKHRSSLPNIRSTPTVRKDFLNHRSGSVQQNLDQEFLTMQKQKLLNELAIQKEQLLEEQSLLDGLPLSPRTEELKKSPYTRRVSRDQVLEDYEKKKIEEELRAQNFKTFLNCRRNSFHIKMTHINKNMSPSLGSSKRENLAKMAEMEKKLNKTQASLALIDRELKEGNATKQHNLDRLQRKRDLELLIIEQQEAVNFISCKPATTDSKHQRRRSYDLSMSASSVQDTNLFFTQNDVPLPSPTTLSPETSLEAFQFLSQPGSPPNPFKFPFPSREKSRFYLGDDDVTTDEDSGFQASTERLEGESDPFSHQSLKSSSSDSSKQSSEMGGLRTSSSSCEIEDPSIKLRSPLQSPHETEKIDSDILAKIEDFELFARMKLQETKRKNEINSKETKI